jgi:hypothetical protein
MNRVLDFLIQGLCVAISTSKNRRAENISSDLR